MLILGVDPGLLHTGWGVIRSEGSALRYVASGVINPPTDLPLALRLAALHEQLSDILKTYQPDTAAVEETFVNKDAKATLKLGHARGIALSVPALYGVEVGEYAANKVKKSVVGAGHASKDQVAMMVKTLLPACGQVKADEADALAVAICHAHYGTMNKRLRA